MTLYPSFQSAMAIVWAGLLVFLGLIFVGLQLEIVAKAIRNININLRMGTVKLRVEESEGK